MTKFNRPQNTIDDVRSLRVGDHLWHVYGIWPPQMGGDHFVTRAAGPFKNHPEYSNIHSLSGDGLVFDVKWANETIRPTMEFASDGNLIPGHSHNNNYWFRSEADALAAVDFLRAEWERHPEAIAEDTARREEMLREFDYVD